jgi:hypothetical protein
MSKTVVIANVASAELFFIIKYLGPAPLLYDENEYLGYISKKTRIRSQSMEAPIRPLYRNLWLSSDPGNSLATRNSCGSVILELDRWMLAAVPVPIPRSVRTAQPNNSRTGEQFLNSLPYVSSMAPHDRRWRERCRGAYQADVVVEGPAGRRRSNLPC